jgi:hypothetical protein
MIVKMYTFRDSKKAGSARMKGESLTGRENNVLRPKGSIMAMAGIATNK